MGDLIAAVTANRHVAHVMRAGERFDARLGNQFAAAITYFSVLAMVPVAMFVFASVGATITVLRPELLDEVTATITASLGDSRTAAQVSTVVSDALHNWRSVAGWGLVPLAYAGAGWVGNLRKAVDAMWRPSFDITPDGGGPLGFVVDFVKNLAILAGLVVLGLLTVAASSVTSGLLGDVLELLGFTGSSGSGVLAAGGVVLSLVSGWVLFVYLYTVLPHERHPFREVARGAVLGAVLLALLQFFAGAATTMFARNPTAALFGPIIVLMLAFNLFATVVMLVAAWTATWDEAHAPAVAVAGESGSDPGSGAPEAAPLATPTQTADEPRTVPEQVARRGVGVGMGLGWLTGAATGLGLGALVGRVVAGVVHRRRRRTGR